MSKQFGALLRSESSTDIQHSSVNNCIVLHVSIFTVTDFPKSHPDSNLFLDCGIDMMNMPEFLSAFVGKSVIDKPEQQSLGEGKH